MSLILVLVALLAYHSAVARDGLVPVDPVDPTVTVEEPAEFDESPPQLNEGANDQPPRGAIREGLNADGDLVPEPAVGNEASPESNAQTGRGTGGRAGPDR